MTDAQVLEIALEAMMTAAKLAGPILLTVLAIGVFVGLLQSVTQVQEATLAFVPKFAAVAVVLLISGSWMLAELIGFTRDLFAMIPSLITGGEPVVTVALAPELLAGFLFALVRTSAWIVVAPPFSSGAIPGRVKLVISVSIALVLAPKLGHRPELFELGPFVTGLAYQAFIGLALGFVVLLIFSAVQAAGELLDLFSGFSASSLYDPFSNSTSSPMGRLYQLVAVALLFAMNGHLMLVRGFMASFAAAPLSGPRLDDLARLFTRDVATLLVSALEIAAPLLAALFLAELAMGLLGRAAPQTQVMTLGFAVKIAIVLVLSGLALPLLPGTVEGLVDEIVRTSTRLVAG